MHTSKTSYPVWVGICVAYLWRLALVVGYFALALWLWPGSVLQTPLSAFTLGFALRALVSVACLSVGITSLYFVAIEPFVLGYTELFHRDQE